MTRLQEKLYARRYQRAAKVGDKLVDLAYKAVFLAFILYVEYEIIDALFPNVPLK